MSSPESIKSQVGDVESPPQSSSTTFATQFPGGLPPTNELKLYSGANLASMLCERFSIVKDTTKHSPNARPKHDHHNSAVLQPVSSERLVEISSRISAKNNERHGRVDNEKQDKDFHQSSSYGERMPSHESEKENSQESLKGGGQPMTNQHSTAEVVNLVYEGKSRAELSAMKSPFEGLTRVPKTYVRIPDDQKALLESDGSWITTGNSSRRTFANLPTKVLEKLTMFNEGVKLTYLGGGKLGNEGFISTEAGSDEDKESEKGSIVETATGNAEAEPQNFEDAEILKSCAPFDADMTDEDDLVSWPTTPDRDIPASYHSRSPTQPLDPSHQTQEQYTPGDRWGDPTWLESGFHGASRRPVREASPELRWRKHEDELVLRDPVVTDQRPISRGTSNGSSDERHLHSSRLMEAGAITPVEPPRDQSHVLNSGIAPSSSPAEEMELAPPHAIDEALEDVIQMRDTLTAQPLVPSTAFHGRQQVQVEQTPFGDPRMQTTHGDGQQRPFKRFHKEFSSDVVIPATLIENGSQDHISFSGMSGTINAETNLHLSKFTSESVEGQVCRSNGYNDSLRNQPQTEFVPPQQMMEEAIDTSLPKGPDDNSLNHHNSGTLAEVKMREVKVACSAPSQALQHQASMTYHVPVSKVKVQNPALPPAPARQSPGSGQSTPRKRRRLTKERATAIPNDFVVRDTKEMARANRRAFQANLLSPNEDALSPRNELVLPAKMLPLDSDDKYNTASKLIDRQAIGSVLQLSAKTSSRQKAYQQASAPQNQNVTDHPVTSKLFDEYKAAYPSFTGDRMAFLKALVYIEWLGKRDKAPHKALWDDFVRTFCQDFPAYIASCRALNKTPKTGIDFYNDEIYPNFNRRVITPYNLQSGLSCDSEDANLIRHQFHKSRTAEKSLEGLSQLGAKVVVPEDHEVARDHPHSNENDIASDTSSYLMPGIRPMACNKLAKRKPFFETASQINATATSTRVPDICADDGIRTPRRLPWSRDAFQQASDSRSMKSQQGSPGDRQKVYLRQSSGSPILGREREDPFSRLQSKSETKKTPITSSSHARSDTFGLTGVSRSKTFLHRTTSLPQARKASVHGLHGPGTSTATSPPGSGGRNVSFDLFVKYKARGNGFSSTTSIPHSKPLLNNRNLQKSARISAHKSVADACNVYLHETVGAREGAEPRDPNTQPWDF